MFGDAIPVYTPESMTADADRLALRPHDIDLLDEVFARLKETASVSQPEAGDLDVAEAVDCAERGDALATVEAMWEAVKTQQLFRQESKPKRKRAPKPKPIPSPRPRPRPRPPGGWPDGPDAERIWRD